MMCRASLAWRLCVYMCIHIEEFEVRLGVRRDDLEEVRLKGKKVE